MEIMVNFFQVGYENIFRYFERAITQLSAFPNFPNLGFWEVSNINSSGASTEPWGRPLTCNFSYSLMTKIYLRCPAIQHVFDYYCFT